MATIDLDSTTSYNTRFSLQSISIQETLNNNLETSEERSSSISSEEIRSWKEKAVRRKIAIIGGGAAGMSALKTFLINGYEDVVLLEAQDTLGGRIRTFRNGKLHLEEGAEWIHGEDRNVIYKIAKELNQLSPIHENYYDLVVREDGTEIKNDYVIFDIAQAIIEETNENGILKHLYDFGYGEYFFRRFEEEARKLHLNPKEFKAWMHFMEQIINSNEGTGNWNDISARDADLFVAYGKDAKWKSGYDTIVKYFSNSFNSSFYLLNTPVTHILWDFDSSDDVLIKTGNDKYFLVNKVVVTVSVGCLKKWRETVFVPPIPDPLRSALQTIKLGNSNKIFCGWQKKWWGMRPLSVNVLWTDFNLPKNMEWLYGIVEIFTIEEDANILRAFVSGKYSLQMEEKDEREVQKDFLFLLKHILSQFYTIPEPCFFRRTKWNSNPWTCGSYESYITPEGNKNGIHSRVIYREPLKNTQNRTVIYWAGEHTHDSRYGTVDGAIESGCREANTILNQNDIIL